MGLAGDQIDRSWRRWPKGGVVRVVAYREVLRVIPQRRHRVPVDRMTWDLRREFQWPSSRNYRDGERPGHAASFAAHSFTFARNCA